MSYITQNTTIVLSIVLITETPFTYGISAKVKVMPKCWDSLERVIISRTRSRVPEVGLLSWLLDGELPGCRMGLKIFPSEKQCTHKSTPTWWGPGEPAGPEAAHSTS